MGALCLPFQRRDHTCAVLVDECACAIIYICTDPLLEVWQEGIGA